MGSPGDTPKSPVIEAGWLEVLHDQFISSYFADLKQFLMEERALHTVYPSGSKIFAAFNHTPFDRVRVVILGQDPYHGEGQAHGLCFSVPEGIRPPPSLVNIFKELSSDVGITAPMSGDLTGWARQGVLLLNATLTVRAHAPASHQNKGWELFTDTVIRRLSQRRENLVFLLWGNPAQRKGALIDSGRHLILKAPHPSPLSAHRGYLGCRHFSQTNAYFQEKGLPVIDWNPIS
jgi:uracil-DNA glycosylase